MSTAIKTNGTIMRQERSIGSEIEIAGEPDTEEEIQEPAAMEGAVDGAPVGTCSCAPENGGDGTPDTEASGRAWDVPGAKQSGG